MTCVNPEIRYGSVTGGIPRDGDADELNNWCEQLDGKYKSHTVGTRTGYCVFGCTIDDDLKWKWCDCGDGYWYNQVLDYYVTLSDFITSITCEF